MTLTSQQLSAVMPRCPKDKVDEYARLLSEALVDAQCTTVTRAAALLGQLALESGELRFMQEIGDGSAYEGRRDLGNVELGDGRRYKGRGFIQITGRANYREAGAAIGLDLEGDPSLAEDPWVAAKIVAWYWKKRRINDHADSLDYSRVTRAINGASTFGPPSHHERRLKYYHAALEVLGAAAKIT